MSDRAIQGFATVQKVLRDGSVRLTVDVKQEDAHFVGRMMMTPETPVAIAVLNLSIKAEENEQEDFGAYAQELYQSGFFRTPDVWRALGTDADYLKWLRSQPCVARNLPSMRGLHCITTIERGSPEAQELKVEAAHVRRVANGSGMAIKPTYSAVSLCQVHHHLQHQHGYSGFGGIEWFERKRIEQVQEWAKEVLRQRVGVESLKFANPLHVLQWAESQQVAHLLPKSFREFGMSNAS